MADTPTPAQPGLVNADTVSTVVRAVFKFGGGYIIHAGFTDSSNWEKLTGAVVGLTGILWGIYSAHQDAKAKAA